MYCLDEDKQNKATWKYAMILEADIRQTEYDKLTEIRMLPCVPLIRNG